MTGQAFEVWIATTEGPAKVLRVARERPEVRSVICVDGGTEALPVSAAYDAFVREPTGVVERAVGHPVFRIDLSRPVDEGRSWQLGLFIAHQLENTGQLAEPDDEADTIILATGEVNRELAVRTVDHVPEKLRRARDLLTTVAADGKRTVLIVPEANRGDVALADLPDDVSIVSPSNAEAIIEELRPSPLVASTRPVDGKGRGWTMLALLCGAMLIAAGAIAYTVPDLRVPLMASLHAPTGTNQERPTPTNSSPSPAPAPTVDLEKQPEPEPEPASLPKPLPAAAEPARTKDQPPKPVASTAPPKPLFAPALVAVELTEWRPRKNRTCDQGGLIAETVAPGAASGRVCRLSITATNQGALDASVVLAADLVDGRAEYMRADKYRGLIGQRLKSGASVTLELNLPSWVRREMTFALVAAIASAKAHPAGLAPDLTRSRDPGVVELDSLKAALPSDARIEELHHTIRP